MRAYYILALSILLAVSMEAAALSGVKHDRPKVQSLASEFSQTMAIGRESVMLAGLDAGRASLRLQQSLAEDYGLLVQCGSGWLHSLSDISCLIATRTLARALYSSLINPFPSEDRGLLKIEFEDAAEVSVLREPEGNQISMPYNLQASEMASVIQAETLGVDYRQKAWVRAQFQAQLDNLQANLTVPLIFSSELSLSEKWVFVNNLSGLAAKDPRVLDRLGQEIEVGYHTQGLHEQSLRLVENVDVRMPADQLHRFLLESSESDQALQAQRDMQIVNDRIEQSISKIAQSTGAQVQCSPADQLSSLECLNTLQRLQSAFSRQQVVVLPAKEILVVSAQESQRMIDSFTAPETAQTVLVVREDFFFGTLANFFFEKGWTL